MQTGEAITSRRNVRSFSGRPIPAADLDQILEAGRRSPQPRWTPVPSPNPADDDRLDGVAATSASNAVAVGTGQSSAWGALPTTLTLRWDGTAWAPAPSIQIGGPGIENTLTGVAAISPTEAWAVGFFGPTPLQALAFHLK